MDFNGLWVSKKHSEYGYVSFSIYTKEIISIATEQ